MIFYFSGTGNSRFVAQRLAGALDEPLRFIPNVDRDTLTFEGETLGFVFPIYSWGIPPVVMEFIDSLGEKFLSSARGRNRGVWCVCTCGDETGDAPAMLVAELEKKRISLNALWSVIMPNNYVLLPGFDVDSREVELNKLDEAPFRVEAIAEKISAREWEMDYVRGNWPRLKTKAVYPLFKRWGINPRKWHWTPECIQCGRCASACPMGNVELVGRHPRWGKNCVSCLACYHVCPTHAVAYGKATRHKGQYWLQNSKR